jgi:hypothetical protein
MSDRIGFGIAPGAFVSLSNREDHRAYYVFDGDLSQMGTIETHLRAAGFNVVKTDVYPGFPKDQEEEFVRALKYVFDNRIHGWWSQRHNLLEYRICTEAEFSAALDRA